MWTLRLFQLCRFSIFFSIGIVASIGFAKNYHLQIVGIDEVNPMQNDQSLYNDAAYFSEYCRSNGKTCEQYINLNPKLLEPGAVIPKGLRSSDYKGTPTKSEILKRIRNLIDNANDGDKVVIHLDNHGGPGKSDSDTSCIYLSHKEKICDGDLKEIFKDIKPGVQIGLIADGCFSGGFAQLANSQICVAMSADQNMIGFAQRESEQIWRLVGSGKIRSFTDISRLRNAVTDSELMTQFRNGADVMKLNTCISIVERVQAKMASKYHFDFGQSVLDDIYGQSCKGPEGAMRLVTRMGEVSRNIFTPEVEKEFCADAGQSAAAAEVCRNWKSFSAGRTSLTAIELQAKLDQNQKNLRDKTIRVLTTIEDPTRKAIIELAQEYLDGETGDHGSQLVRWRNGTTVEKQAREIVLAYQAYKESSNTLIGLRRKLSQDQRLSEKDLNFIKDCVFKGNNVGTYQTASQRQFNRQGKKRIQFTPQQYEQAKKCENEFVF